MYTLQQRDVLFQTFTRQLEVLIVRADPNSPAPREVGLDHKLLMDFLFAGMNCPGFSERQRAMIADASHRFGQGMGVSLHARNWPFQTLAPHPALLSDQDVGMWLELLTFGIKTMMTRMRERRSQRGVAGNEDNNNGGDGAPAVIDTGIGIAPYLEIKEDTRTGCHLFTYTTQGAALSRARFSCLERELMQLLTKVGWTVYMQRFGVSSAHFPGLPGDEGKDDSNDNVDDGNAKATYSDLLIQNNPMIADLIAKYENTTDLYGDDDEAADGDNSGGSVVEYTPEERLAACRSVLAEVERNDEGHLGQEEWEQRRRRAAATNANNPDGNATGGGRHHYRARNLASGLAALNVSASSSSAAGHGNSNPNFGGTANADHAAPTAASVFAARVYSAPGLNPPLNPETPIFEPQGWRSRGHVSHFSDPAAATAGTNEYYDSEDNDGVGNGSSFTRARGSTFGSSYNGYFGSSVGHHRSVGSGSASGSGSLSNIPEDFRISTARRQSSISGPPSSVTASPSSSSAFGTAGGTSLEQQHAHPVRPTHRRRVSIRYPDGTPMTLTRENAPVGTENDTTGDHTIDTVTHTTPTKAGRAVDHGAIGTPVAESKMNGALK
jgi:hypothetical protein